MKVLHLSMSLAKGGAEGFLSRLIQETHKTGVNHSVVTLLPRNDYKGILSATGTSWHSLDMTRGRIDLEAPLKLRSIMASERPDLVQTWMYHADLLGGLTAMSRRRLPVIWSVRHSDLGSFNNKQTFAVVRACSLLSRILPKKIIYASKAARHHHESKGYARHVGQVIHNGYESARYYRLPPANNPILGKLRGAPSTPVVGFVGRFDAQKDIPSFLTACANIARRVPIRVLMCGPDIADANPALKTLIQSHGLLEHTTLLGFQTDLIPVYSAMSVLLLSSSNGEAFPNVVAEAMLCETPCVVTDVGDAAVIVGASGKVVAKRDPQGMARAVLELLSMTQNGLVELGAACRRDVSRRFPISAVAREYQQAYSDVAKTSSSI